MKKNVKIWNTMGSINRPSWLSDNLHAYRNKYVTKGCRRVELTDYYHKRKGMR